MQFLFGNEQVGAVGQGDHKPTVGGSGSAETTEGPISQHLPPIAEESHESESTQDTASLDAYLASGDPVLQKVLAETRFERERVFERVLVDAGPPDPTVEVGPPLSYLTHDQIDVGIHPPAEAVLLNPEDDCTLEISPPMTKTIPGLPQVAPNETVVFKTTEEGTRRIVTQRDDDLLTAAELQQHKKSIEAAMLKELHLGKT